MWHSIDPDQEYRVQVFIIFWFLFLLQDALNESLMKLLTPKRRIDIIRDVMEVQAISCSNCKNVTLLRSSWFMYGMQDDDDCRHDYHVS